jgi:hypothetical protein
MEFRKEETAAFLELFDQVKTKILVQEGCEKLELLRANNNQTIFFTYSYWKDEASLNKYRETEFFKSTWKKTKALFASPAKAWSTTRLYPQE